MENGKLKIFSDARGVYPYGTSLTRPVRYMEEAVDYHPLASPGGKLDFLPIGSSEPIGKKD